MPLEICPVCGYAVASADFHCRHCPEPLEFLPSKYLDAKFTLVIIAGLGILGFLFYLIAWH